MRRTSIALACALIGMSGSAALAAPRDHAAHHHPVAAERSHDDIEAARRATARFRDLRVALREGYEPAGACVPGMGFHYANPELVEDPELDVRKPELLVYEQGPHVKRLVAIEYMSIDADQRLDTDDDRPYLFETHLDGPMEGHEPGQPVHYDLHAWLYKHNPYGLFEAYNARVTC
jgi:hypothetical protein